ncbi:unnamed protein product [Closterium sp. Naga37s-1]|nr:unnamed protein product [Closterium sp. Naga37s-1]
MKRRGATRQTAIAVLALLLLGLATCRSQPEEDEALTGQPAALPDDIEVADAFSAAIGGGSSGGGGTGGDGADTYSDDWEDPLPGDHPNGDDTIVDTSDDVEADNSPANAARSDVIPGNRKPGDLVPGEEEGEAARGAQRGAGRGVKGGAEKVVRAQAEGEAERGGAEEWEAQEELAEEEPENPWVENGRGESSSAAVAQAQDYQPGGEDGFAEGLSGKAEAQAQDDQTGGKNGFAEGLSGKAEAEEEPSSDWPAGEAGESAEEEVGDGSESGTATIQEADNGYGDTGGTYERNVPAQRDGGAEQPAQGDAWTFEEDQPGQGGEQGGEMGEQGGGGEPGAGTGEGGSGDERGDNSDYFFQGKDPEEEEWQKRKHNWQNAGPNSDSNDPNAADDANGPSDYNEAEQTRTPGSPVDANPNGGSPDDDLFSDNNPSSSDETFPDSSNPAAQDTAAAKMADSATTGSGSEGSEPAAPASNSYSEGYEKMAGGQISAEGILGIVLGVTLGAGLCLLVVCVCWVRQRNINRAKESEAMTAYDDYSSEVADQEGLKFKGLYATPLFPPLFPITRRSEAMTAYDDDSSEEEDEEGLEEAADTALMGGIVGAHRALDIEAQQALKSSKR